MPVVSRFFGVEIRMYYNDHMPAHFHAQYGGDEAIYEIASFDRMRGALPRRAHAMVLEWASIHRDELVADWYRAADGIALHAIDPLD